MTYADETFERTVHAWLHADAEHRVPEHLDAVLQRTSVARQRPAWSSLERWLPVDTTLRPRLFNLPSPGRLVLVAAVILALVGLLIFATGSRQQRLPPPFGLARNGALVAGGDGDIYRLDARTHERVPLITGSSWDFGPAYSRDGSKFSFLRTASKPGDDGTLALTLVVADADGSNVRELVGPVSGLDWLDWSPDGRQIGFLSRRGDGYGMLNVVDVETGHTTPFDAGVSVAAGLVAWRPPDGRSIVFKSDGDAGDVYVVHPDGSGLRRVNNIPDCHCDLGSLSPDGRFVVINRFTPKPVAVVLLDLESGLERALPAPDRTEPRGGSISPDGLSVAFSRIHPISSDQAAFDVVVAPVDGSGVGRTLGPTVTLPPGYTGWQAFPPLAFSPDGAAVIAQYPTGPTYIANTVRWLPVDGSAGSVIDEGEWVGVDIQRLAP